MTDPLVWLVVLLGGPVGSFLAAYADRTCRGVSLWRRSYCTACEAPIAPLDLVPIVSWFVLRGRCRNCGARLPRGLVIAEIAGVVLALVAIAGAPDDTTLLLRALFLWALLGLALADLECFRLPDAFSGLLFATGLALAWSDPTRTMSGGLATALTGAAALWLVKAGYMSLARREGLGLGDVKMIAGLGAGLGWMALPWIGLIAASTGLAAAALGVFGPPHRQTAVPFGTFLALAGGIVMAVAPFLT